MDEGGNTHKHTHILTRSEIRTERNFEHRILIVIGFGCTRHTVVQTGVIAHALNVLAD